MKRKLIFVILIILILTFSVTIVNAVQINKFEFFKEKNSNLILSKNSIANWTIMHYMCGDSNMNDYIDPLLENLTKIGSDDELNIVCLIDKISYGNSKLAYISETGEIIELNEMYGWPDEVDMKNLNTFELFCTQMMVNFPAKYYGLIIFASGRVGWQGYDLVRLLRENIQNDIIKSKCDDVLEKIDQTIPFVQQNPNVTNCGLNIYFPSSMFMYNKFKYKGKTTSPYEELKFSEDTCWDEFLKYYLDKI